MNPRDFLDSYWRPTIRDSVFVAMPFHDEFTPIWQNAIQPTIETGQGLSAERVDATVLSGSIVMRILDGIAHARIILADISVAQEGKWKGQRNGNVMYEVGIAHASRQSSEVLLVRSDDEEINFDLAGIQVHSYDRSNITATRIYFDQILKEALLQIDQTKSLQVQKVVDALDVHALEFIQSSGKDAGFYAPEPTNMAGALLYIPKAAALTRLQTFGVVHCDPKNASGKPVFYWSEFGKAVIAHLNAR
jgi:hypothetical protein